MRLLLLMLMGVVLCGCQPPADEVSVVGGDVTVPRPAEGAGGVTLTTVEGWKQSAIHCERHIVTGVVVRIEFHSQAMDTVYFEDGATLRAWYLERYLPVFVPGRKMRFTVLRGGFTAAEYVGGTTPEDEVSNWLLDPDRRIGTTSI